MDVDKLVGPTAVRQAAILCGGLGTRLGDLTARTPKPLLPVSNRPFLDSLVLQLARHGVRDIVLLAGFAAEQVMAYAEQTPLKAQFGLRFEVSIEPGPAGTGGALWHARSRLDETFFLLNGDSLFDINLLALPLVMGDDALAVLAVRQTEDAGRYGAVDLAGGRITGFREKSPQAAPGWMNAGIYLCRRGLVEQTQAVCSLERDVFPALAAQGRLGAAPADGFFLDIGVPASYAEAQTSIPRQGRKRAVFLDRDGVLNVNHGHVGQIERFEWITGARQAVRRLNDAGCYVFVASNQAGVAKGRYTLADVAVLQAHMTRQLAAVGAHVDDWRYCPYHPDGVVPAYAQASDWRKPEPGMLLDILNTWDCDRPASFMIGDKPWDMEAARRASLAGHLFTGGDLDAFVAGLLT
ncbi:MAG: D-glycero-alpha-D-manno-heptose,7-bisphosphate 7-phosphatase [Caulobacteraceae bacterium]|nr:D-glycero-alpha-D-manno-heptose,7-bisphosphate 7-phosphatase [Caulobacteraceae bacterium]